MLFIDFDTRANKITSIMLALRRFYLSQTPESETIWLDIKQSHHLKSVLRLKKGNRVEVLNPKGKSYLAEITAFAPKGTQLKILNSGPQNTNGPRLMTQPRSTNPTTKFIRPEITLATAIPKGKRMDILVDQVAELGLNRLIPVNTKRSVVKTTSIQSPKFNRWKRIAVEAAKQSKQNHLLEITEPMSFNAVVKQSKNYDLALLGALNSQTFLSKTIKSNNSVHKIIYLIGPEGDFTTDEINLAVRSGIKPVCLPIGSILRVETAAVTMLSMLYYAYSDNPDSSRDSLGS